MFTDPSADHHTPAIATATNIATHFRGVAQVISIQSSDVEILANFKVEKGSLPAVVVMDVSLMERYPYEEEGGVEFHVQGEYERLVKHVQAVVDRDL